MAVELSCRCAVLPSCRCPCRWPFRGSVGYCRGILNLPVPVSDVFDHLKPALAGRYAVELRRAELYERLGEREQALQHYSKVVELWKDADAELLPVVEDAEQQMVRLVREWGVRSKE